MKKELLDLKEVNASRIVLRKNGKGETDILQLVLCRVMKEGMMVSFDYEDSVYHLYLSSRLIHGPQ
jgi:hypothetical protein